MHKEHTFFFIYEHVCVCLCCTNVVFLFAGDGVAADLSVLDCRQVPDKKQAQRKMYSTQKDFEFNFVFRARIHQILMYGSVQK